MGRGWRCVCGFEEFDDVHHGAAGRTQQPLWRVVVILTIVRWRLCVEQCSGFGNVVCALGVGKETVMANAVKAAGQDMDEETTDKLRRIERHGFKSVFLLGSVVLPLKGNVVFIEVDESRVSDSDPVGVTREVL